ncbi:hypothetical protein [Kitasatospora mediocidica]|uniref:hypothetical protein n=1 Tax=Kitasatospora mediocidica TaxID=58352 RepID=UPI000AA14779|nr:hypothetical protein [Kitasatospora mediocidica]
MDDTITPPEWCEGTDLDNFVSLLRGLKDSLAEDLEELEGRKDPAGARGEAVGGRVGR